MCVCLPQCTGGRELSVPGNCLAGNVRDGHSFSSRSPDPTSPQFVIASSSGVRLQITILICQKLLLGRESDMGGSGVVSEDWRMIRSPPCSLPHPHNLGSLSDKSAQT